MAEENNIITKTVENVDRMFSQIVVNGEVHNSERYVSPQSQQASPANSPAQSTQGEDVYGVELNNILHNFVDRAVTQSLADEETARQNADNALQQGIDIINSKIPSTASSSNKLADSASVSSEIENAINALDVAQAGGNGKFIQSVSETDGKISATEGTIDSSVSQGSGNPVSGGAVHTAIGAVQTSVQGIEDLIPAQATSSNQLADKDFVNSSISTNTANFIGTFESVTDLEDYSGTVTNNDYAFVRNTVIQYNGGDFPNVTALNNYDKTTLTNGDYAWVVNSEDNTKYDLYRFDIVEQSWALRNTKIDKSQDVLNSFFNRYKATISGSTVTWIYEYTLNNSSFTASQWATINSGLTSTSVSDAIESLDVPLAGGAGKYIEDISETNGKINATSQTMDTTPTQNSTKACTSGGIYTALQNVTVPVDIAMSDSSSNAVENKVIKSYVDDCVAISPFKFGTRDSSIPYIKIKINPKTDWMLNFTITLYQSYRATKIMVSGYNYGTSHWYSPSAVIIADSNENNSIPVYFGYDADWELWVAVGGGNYTGISITDVANGYTQIPDPSGLFTITQESSLGGTTQSTVTAVSRAQIANSIRTSAPASPVSGDIWIV